MNSFGINKLTTKVKGALKAFMDWNKDSDCSIVIETDLQQHDRWDNSADKDCVIEDMANDMFIMDELHNYSKVKDEIEATIRDSCKTDLNCQIIVPQTLTSRVSEDIVRMSLSEPCGVHGCAIYIVIQDKEKSYPLSTIYGNMSAPPTFEIHLTLREDNCGWRKVHKAFLQVKGCILTSRWKVAPKILRPSYQLEKRKLYRSGSSSEVSQSSLKV